MADNHFLKFTRLQILSAVEKLNNAARAIDQQGQEYPLGDVTFRFHEGDVVNWLYSAKEFLDSAIMQAQRARAADDSLEKAIRSGGLTKSAERGAA